MDGAELASSDRETSRVTFLLEVGREGPWPPACLAAPGNPSLGP